MLMVDQDFTTCFSLFFMLLSGKKLRIIYSGLLVLWAWINVAEAGFILLEKKRIAGLSLMRPYFVKTIAN